MNHLNRTRIVLSILTMAFTALVSPGYAQKPGAEIPLVERMTKTPDNVFQLFHEAGMSATEHTLTAQEREFVAEAFKLLPPMHQRILKEHLEGISFLDNMPNTALTSIIIDRDSVNHYHISFRAAILHQTISAWLAEKENTCFATDSSGVALHFEAGNLNAIVYVLLHETTHVVDGSLRLFDDVDTGFGKQFTAGIWRRRTVILGADSLLNKNHFRRGGQLYPIGMAPAVYTSLQKTPFVSLYSTSSWSEDLAESLAVYHLTTRLKQPFKLIVTENGKRVLEYEPMKSSKVAERMKGLKVFYD